MRYASELINKEDFETILNGLQAGFKTGMPKQLISQIQRVYNCDLFFMINIQQIYVKLKLKYLQYTYRKNKVK